MARSRLKLQPLANLLNLKRVLRRLWSLMSIGFIITVHASYFYTIREAFRDAATLPEFKHQSAPLLSVQIDGKLTVPQYPDQKVLAPMSVLDSSVVLAIVLPRACSVPLAVLALKCSILVAGDYRAEELPARHDR